MENKVKKITLWIISVFIGLIFNFISIILLLGFFLGMSYKENQIKSQIEIQEQSLTESDNKKEYDIDVKI